MMLHRFIYLFVFIIAISFAPKMGLLAKVKKHAKTEQGEKAYAKGNYNKALEYFQEAIESGDPRGEAYYYIGSILEFRRDYDSALEYYEEANKRPLEKDFKKAVLWKLILLHKAKQNYPKMLEYIDQMEARGINHKNFEGFREEAEKHMTPEKVEAQRLIKEANEEVAAWEKEHSGKSFWKKTNPNAASVIGKYKRAIELDSGLYAYKWKVAGFLEKMERWRDSYEIYSDILKTDSRAIVYYKMGLMLKRLDEYRRSASTFEKSLSKVKEDDSLNLYIYLNLSQVYYPLGEYSKGSEAAKKSKKFNKRGTNRAFSFSDYMICLHELSIHERSTESEESTKSLVAVCDAIVKNTQMEKVGKGQKGMLHYLRGAYSLAVSKEGESSVNNIDSFEEFQMAFLPPALRNLKRNVLLHISKNSLRPEETQKWSPLPNWLEARVVYVFLYFIKLEKWAEAYTLAKIYPQKIGTDYRYSLVLAEYNLELYEQVINDARQVRNRDFEMEKIYLTALLEFHIWEDFQTESLAYAAKSAENEQKISDWLKEIQPLKKIPMGKQNMKFIKKFFQKPAINDTEQKEKELIDDTNIDDTNKEETDIEKMPEPVIEPESELVPGETSTPEVKNTKEEFPDPGVSVSPE